MSYWIRVKVIGHSLHAYDETITVLPLSYFSMVVCLRCLLHHFLSLIAYIFREKRFFFHCYCAVYDECKYSDTIWLADHVRLFVHYTISLSSLCKLIWKQWTYEMPVRYILSSVWVRLGIFSQLPIIQYMGLCVFSLPISLVLIERIYILSYYHHQIGSMNYYPLFGVRSWNNGMRCMSLYSYHENILYQSNQFYCHTNYKYHIS